MMSKVLLVSGDEAFLQNIMDDISNSDEELVLDTALSGKKGLEKVEGSSSKYDAILLDHEITDLDIFEFQREMRGKVGKTPLIVIGDQIEENILKKIYQKGADYRPKKIFESDKGLYILISLIEREIDRLEAEKGLRRYKALVENSIVGIYIIQDDVFKYVNPEFCRMQGYEEEELIGKDYLDIISPEDKGFIKKSVEERKRKGGISRHVFKGLTKEGGEKYFEAHSVSTRFKGRPAIQGTLLDVSARKEAKRKLKESQERFKNLFQLTPDLVFMINKEGVFENINDTFIEITGYEEEEVIGKSYQEVGFLTERAVNKLDEKLKASIEGKDLCPFSLKISSKDKNKRFLEINMETMVQNEEVIGEICVARDITERKRLEDLSNGLLQSREVGVTVIKDGKIVEMNPYSEDITGYSEDELIGMDSIEFIPPDERKEAKKKTDEMLKGGRKEPYEHRFVKKDGEEGWVLEQVSPIHYEGERAILATFVDITERKRAEERQEFLHSLLRHDIMNKNQVVQSYLQLLQEKNLDQSVEDFIDKAMSTIKESSEQIRKVRQLRDVDEEKEIKSIDIDDLLSTTIRNKRMEAEEKGIDIKYDGKMVEVKGGGLTKELFSNLIENSIRHSKGTQILVSIEERERTVLVKIEDDGKGIPNELEEKIFDRGFKGKGSSGSGLGMHLVKKICETYGGNIIVKDSELGGARFDIELEKG